jgi:2-aminomuconate deaminase
MSQLFSNKAPDPVGAYPHARRAGPFLFLSGVGPREPGTGSIPGNVTDGSGNLLSYDIEQQCHSVFRNIRNILEDCDARWDDLVDVTVFLTNMRTDFEQFNKIYADYFKSVRPCRTTVEVNALPTPIAIELKCIAWIDAHE